MSLEKKWGKKREKELLCSSSMKLELTNTHTHKTCTEKLKKMLLTEKKNSYCLLNRAHQIGLSFVPAFNHEAN